MTLNAEGDLDITSWVLGEKKKRITVIHQQVGPETSLFEDRYGCRSRREYFTNRNVKPQTLQFGYKLLPGCLGLIGAETQLQVWCFQPYNKLEKHIRL